MNVHNRPHNRKGKGTGTGTKAATETVTGHAMQLVGFSLKGLARPLSAIALATKVH